MTDTRLTPVEELGARHVDVQPEDADWSEGYPDDWEFWEAGAVEQIPHDQFKAVCEECGDHLVIEMRTPDFEWKLHHDDDPEDPDPDHDHEPVIDYDMDTFQTWRLTGIYADHFDAVAVGSGGQAEVFDVYGEELEGPMMNWRYECDVDHEADAALLLKDLPVVVVRFTDEEQTYLALSGGGMDLSWEICEAYMRLGFLPPAHFCGLPGMAGTRATERNLWIVDGCRRSLQIQSDSALRTLARLNDVAANLDPATEDDE